ncbi:MAG: hypothetical protein WC774_05970, partial [Candidatus Gracilibacteria bacterium]
MQNILEKRAELINQVGPQVLDAIGDVERSVRREAVSILETTLNPQSDEDKSILQTIPLELLERSDLIGAIWYLETTGESGNTISLEVLERVVQQAVREREQYLSSGDEKAAAYVVSSIENLFTMAQNHIQIQNNPELFLIIGNYKEMLGEQEEAIACYGKIIEKGNAKGYIALAKVYANLEQYEESIGLLNKGYALFRDADCLGELITVLCRTGEISQAETKYMQLKKLNTHNIPSFLEYKGTIESDTELFELENLITDYVRKEDFTPSKILHRLTISAHVYITNEIKKEGVKLNSINRKEKKDWKEYDYKEYSQSIIRKLHLMQIDIFTLGNERCIEQYLKDLQHIGINGTPESRNLLSEFFREYFSKEVERSLREMDAESGETIEYGKDGLIGDLSFFESISAHVGRIGELFFQPNLYDIHKKYITPILHTSHQLNGISHEKDEDGDDINIDYKRDLAL